MVDEILPIDRMRELIEEHRQHMLSRGMAEPSMTIAKGVYLKGALDLFEVFASCDSSVQLDAVYALCATEFEGVVAALNRPEYGQH